MAYQFVPPKPYQSSNGINYDLQWDPTNGKVQLIQQNAASGTVPVYSDGKWNSNATGLGFNSTEQQTIHNNIQVSIRSAFNAAGGIPKGNVLPAWAQPSQQGQAPGQSTITPSQPINQNASNPANIAAGFGAIFNPGDALSKIGQNFGVGNEEVLFKAPMKYPLDLKIKSQDTMIITAYEYIPPNRESLLDGTIGSIIQNGLGRGADRLKSYKGIVFLPMPNGLAESKEVAWGPDSLNSLNAGVLNDVMKNTEAYLGGAAVAGVLGGAATKFFNKDVGPLEILSGAGGGAAKGMQVGALGRAITSATGSAEGEGLIAAASLDRMLALTQFGVPAETILSRVAGVVPNDNMELLFGGPTLRSFSVSYRLTARSRNEAKEIRRIIRFFKQTMSPRKRSGAAGQQSVFLGTPYVYNIKFTTIGGAENEAVSRFKTCALTNFQTDYTPDGQWMAYDEGQPISTRITFAFTELEPIYDTDYQTDINSSRVDLSPISNDSVGY